ncbi:unnamed protein product [Trichobilharzia regenti]|nr:unnamed protein product [Trichobilharzia regenti]
MVVSETSSGEFSNFDILDAIIRKLHARNITKLFPVQFKTYDAILSGRDSVVLASDAIRSGCHIVVGAPGRIIDLIDKGVLKLSGVEHVVLDEVDRMLDMGFSKDVEKVLSGVYSNDSSRQKPQTLLFSATMPTWVSSIASKYLSDDHLALLCPYESRASTLSDVIKVYCKSRDSRCIVFCERKKDADELAASEAMPSDCHVLHGDVPQDKRELVLQLLSLGVSLRLICEDEMTKYSRGHDTLSAKTRDTIPYVA